jgi:hypothetical protein
VEIFRIGRHAFPPVASSTPKFKASVAVSSGLV